MNHYYLLFFTATTFAVGAVHLGLAATQSAMPWFAVAVLAAWAGSALGVQERRLRALEEEVARLRHTHEETEESAPDLPVR
jgi:hypothetical protein